MTRSISISLFEHSTLRVGELGFTDVHFDAMARFADAGGRGLFRVGHRKITFANYVGVLQVGNVSVEVLPKADAKRDPDTSKWRSLLISMLAECRYIPLYTTDPASLDVRRINLLEAFVARFLEHIEKIAHEGLRKKYIRKQGNERFWKGKVLFPQHISRNLVDKTRFFAEHDAYEPDNLLNQILVSALRIVRTHYVQPSLTYRSAALLKQLEEISSKDFSRFDFAKIVYDRGSERYRDAVEYARLIIKALSPDVSRGATPIVAFLFDMNRLFEDYVFRCLKSACTSGDVDYVKRQVGRRFWSSRCVRPDIILSVNGQGVVIDTKWKVNEKNQPADSDLKQMYVYNRFFDSQHSMLLYPEVHELGSRYGAYQDQIRNAGIDLPHGCTVDYLDLFNGGSVAAKPDAVGRAILEKIRSMLASHVGHRLDLGR